MNERVHTIKGDSEETKGSSILHIVRKNRNKRNRCLHIHVTSHPCGLFLVAFQHSPATKPKVRICELVWRVGLVAMPW
jgi:hypothetical protein